MHILFLDTASAHNSVALCTENSITASEQLDKACEATLIPTIETMLSNAGLEYKDLTHLAATTGPGGFTSLRIGLATINTLAYTLNLPSVGIHLSDLWSARTEEKEYYWLHSTRKTHLFVRGKEFPEPTLLAIEEAANLEGPYVGELIEEHKETLKKCSHVENVKALTEILPSFLKNQNCEKKQLLPWYGREA